MDANSKIEPDANATATADDTDGNIQCANCDCDLHKDDSYYVEGTGDVCSECDYELTDSCMLCEEHFPSCQRPPYILVIAELTQEGRLPGIYRVIDYPYMFGSMLGNSSMINYNLSFVDRLPKPNREFETGGHICPSCAVPYAKKFRVDYRNADRFKPFSKKRYEREIEVANKTIAEHPELLKDFETDYQPDIEELKGIYNIPESAAFYHEWLYREYKGVKIYHAYYPYSQEDRVKPSWLTLSPAPSARQCRGKTTFDSSGLPNFPMDRYMKLGHYDPQKTRICQETIEFAIDCGAITQDQVAPREDTIWKSCKSPKIKLPKRKPQHA